MRKYTTLLTFLVLLFAVNSCSTRQMVSSPEIISLIQKGEFTFMAERANPMGDVINVINSLPNGGGSRILDLEYGYTIEIKKETLIVTLPYFGRMYTANMDSRKNSFRFTSKDFTINRQDGKKGSSIFTITPNDERNVSKITLEVFANGKSYAQVNANDRQPISYDGYIIKNEELKK